MKLNNLILNVDTRQLGELIRFGLPLLGFGLFSCQSAPLDVKTPSVSASASVRPEIRATPIEASVSPEQSKSKPPVVLVSPLAVPTPAQPLSIADVTGIQECTKINSIVSTIGTQAPGPCYSGVTNNNNTTVFFEAKYREYVERVPFVGKHVALLIEQGSCDLETMTKLINGLDNAYEFYIEALGRKPTPHKVYQGRNVIVTVPFTTCEGAACGYVGQTGIEVMNSKAPGNYFEKICKDAKENEFDQTLLYEFARNFTFFAKKDFAVGNSKDEKLGFIMNTGFAIAMRFLSYEEAGLQGSRFNSEMSFGLLRAKVKTLIEDYNKNPQYTIMNTLAVDKPMKDQFGGASDLFASMLLALDDLYGRKFTKTLWKKMMEQPDAKSTQDALDNFVIAASLASDKNLTNLFQLWRWPFSEKGMARLKELQSTRP